MAKKLEIDAHKLEKLYHLREKKVNPYPYTFSQTHHAADILKKYPALKPEEKTRDKVSIAGRIMLKRVMGKASFLHLQDQSGRIQIYARENDLGKNLYETITELADIGDIIGVTGTIFKTRMGEVTVYTETAQLLSKSLLPMPEKFHGLKEIELKYRRRYVDLFVNPEVRDVFLKRSMMIQTIRNFFTEKQFVEVETPLLQTIYGGAHAKPFITHINTWNMKMYLSISPELFLKRLLVGGFEKVFTICKNFRNEDVDPSHNPEFTMLEVYQTYVDYNAMIEYMEQAYEKACLAVNGTTKVKQIYQGQPVELNFKAPWRRMAMLDAVKQYAQIDASAMSEKQLKSIVDNKKITYDGVFSWGLGVQRLFEELVEDKLVQPIHIIDHPKETTPLCKIHRRDQRLIERFESFCLGMELSNGYSELNDPIQQRLLLEQQAEELCKGTGEAHPMDDDFLNALEYGMPPAGGLGFGIDRMAVILLGQDAIRDVILFPTVKPLPEEQSGKKEELKVSSEILHKHHKNSTKKK